MERRRTYTPIEDYAAIGNLRTVGLAGRGGSIDWLCVPHIHSPSVFGALLDAERGGLFRVSPGGDESRGEQRYVGDSNVVETYFGAPGRGLSVTDFLPVAGDIEGCRRSRAAPELFRVVRADAELAITVVWAPRVDYARAVTRIIGDGGTFEAAGGQTRLFLTGLSGEGVSITRDSGQSDTLRATLSLAAGERLVLAMGWEYPPSPSIEAAARALTETVEVWERWAHKYDETGGRDWASPWNDLLVRSELVLKMLTNADTGAIAAAPTTSLPETMGGVRNWDYRYTWIRDAGMTGQAFVAMGHYAELHEFVSFVERVSEAHRGRGDAFTIMYNVFGEADLPEQELHHLEGYRGSRPVRIGNEAAKQVQHDVLGELVDAADELTEAGMELDDEIWPFLSAVADRAAVAWKERDHGLWEMPLEPRHYVYSKLMIWVALDRAVRLADRHGLEGDAEHWQRAADEVRDLILERGYSRERGSFVQSFDSDALDAAALMIPIQGLLPFEDSRVQSTIDRVMDELMDGGLVRRYVADDGLPGEEGGWVLCTTWLVDNLILSNRHDEARRIFEGLCARANHVGLFSEQIDPRTGEFLGNFPQALSHIGFINSVVFFARARGSDVPAAIPRRARAPGG